MEWRTDLVCKEESFRFSETCIRLAQVSESRLRSLVGKQLAELVSIFGTDIFTLIYFSVLEIAKKALSDNYTEPEPKPEKEGCLQSNLSVLTESRIVNCLETSLEAIAAILKSLEGPPSNNVSFQKELLSFLHQCYGHSNRFVREACQHVMHPTLETFQSELDSVEPEIVDIVAKIIASGMEDNWSQVRFAASLNCRLFLLLLKSRKCQYFSILLPRLRLNCHYAAEGVKSYSLESWKLILQNDGLKTLSELAESFFDYYISQTLAENHSVREAACHAMEEAVERLPFEALERHIKEVIQSLFFCIQDESWPVRDCASVVCGSVTAKYPKQVQESIEMEKLVELWKNALTDNISSVRENSAIALVKACEALDNHVSLNYDTLFEYCSQLMLRVKEQPKNPERYGLRKTLQDTQFGAAHKLAHDNDREIHVEQTMYSCGSLAPKLKGGHSCDRRNRRTKEPWEESDGGLRLWRLLFLKRPKEACALIPLSVEIFEHLEFAKASYLLDTFWSVMGDILGYLDKESVKPYLSILMEQVQIAKRSEYPALEKNAQIAFRKLERLLQS
ncbi:hypothetical protein Gasu2_00370 [Galdieria sulphuraria]|uniref:Uncharacterized protein n=1 Tax=Galdieria sulphuraria TaxID=130081 RepID=M2X9X5_GALSU|nr:uncharacterized protein Gasu_56850 [Galdieria sulphuraria]EME26677.1 hypothetical protein Gasu_56850 [Galdieria sulphuraria]GJD05576.1 hypothetical protein Gasu2_00370 [Galdieria sulphuraria]|eukprot:XP_005703197.1 hypothetical protein Gasu_56850 [Galdieria sulphuraria]